MAALPGGMFLMGSNDADARSEDGEGPVRQVTVSAFEMDRIAVTNAQFEAFVAATGYRTEAETFGWAYVFKGLLSKPRQRRLTTAHEVAAAPWWLAVPGACWRKPEGPGSSLKGRLHHPVVQVSWHDAVAFAEWGRQAPAHRGGVGVRRARRIGWQASTLGRRTHPARETSLQHLARPLPRREQLGGRLLRHRASQVLPTQRLRPLQHGRQCLGMVRRLVRLGLAFDARRRHRSGRAGNRHGQSAARWLLSVPRQLLQSLSRLGALLERAG